MSNKIRNKKASLPFAESKPLQRRDKLVLIYYLSDAVILDNVVHILIASAGEVDEDGAVLH